MVKTKSPLSKMVDAQAKLMCNLCERWIDEHEYEDINEYSAVIKKNLPAGFALYAMTKKPFGFKFTYEQQKYWFKCLVQGDRISLVVEGAK